MALSFLVSSYPSRITNGNLTRGKYIKEPKKNFQIFLVSIRLNSLITTGGTIQNLLKITRFQEKCLQNQMNLEMQ